MNHDNPDREPAIFAAVITPHRSLTRTGFLLVMAVIGGIGFVGGTTFFLMGAWPVVGFMGLEAVLIYSAFRANYRSAAAFEEVTVTASELRVRQVSHRGKVAEWSFNPVWVRLDQEFHDEFGLQRLYLVSRGSKLAVAGFLGPQEKEGFADALAAALGEARRGPTRTLFE